MLMATVQALPALGFAKEKSSRFNAFSLMDSRHAFVEAASRNAQRPNRSTLKYLSDWVTGEEGLHTPWLGRVLSPLG